MERSEREVEADIACAVDSLPWVEGVYVLQPSLEAASHLDVLTFAVVLTAYDIRELVQTHPALLIATGTRELTGRVLYVNGATDASAPYRGGGRSTISASVKTRPEMANRFVFLAGERAMALTPPASVRGRVLVRPVDVDAVRSLLRDLPRADA
jgi:hypothetical protein